MPPDTPPPAQPSAQSPVQPPARSSAPDLGLVDGLVQLSFLVQGNVAKVASEHGMTVVQLRLLGVLRDRVPGMQELARHLGLDKSSMTGLVDRAERRGLVRRSPAPDDGRGVRVSLTEEGRALARSCAAEAAHRVEALTARLTGPERAHLSRLASELLADTTTL